MDGLGSVHADETNALVAVQQEGVAVNDTDDLAPLGAWIVALRGRTKAENKC